MVDGIVLTSRNYAQLENLPLAEVTPPSVPIFDLNKAKFLGSEGLTPYGAFAGLMGPVVLLLETACIQTTAQVQCPPVALPRRTIGPKLAWSTRGTVGVKCTLRRRDWTKGLTLRCRVSDGSNGLP